MKKLVLTIAIVLGTALASFAQGGGFFQRGNDVDDSRSTNNRTSGSLVNMPNEHGLNNNQDAPLGSGIALLAALGGAYLVGKRRKED